MSYCRDRPEDDAPASLEGIRQAAWGCVLAVRAYGEGYSPCSSSVTASSGVMVATALRAKKSATSLSSSALVFGFGGSSADKPRPGCRVSHLERTCFFLPAPGVWIPKPSMSTFQSGWNDSISNDSPNGIQISSATRYRQWKSSISRFFVAAIESLCSLRRLNRAGPGAVLKPKPPFRAPGGTALPT